MRGVAILLAVGCNAEPAPHAAAGPVAPTSEARKPVLPGAIRYVEQRDVPIVVEIAGGQRTELGPDLAQLGRCDRPGPDGTTAIIRDDHGEQRIFLVTGERATRLTDRTGQAFRETQPIWSPDGSLLAYVVERGMRLHVWIRDVKTGLERDVTPEGIVDTEPCWSPDGRWVVVSRTQGHDIDLWAVPAAVGDPVRVTSDRFVDHHATWR